HVTTRSTPPLPYTTLFRSHANTRLRAAAATAHYDDTGYAVCDVAAGEDRWGIWVAGAVSPNATPEQIETLRSSSLSGDGREVRRSEEHTSELQSREKLVCR